MDKRLPISPTGTFYYLLVEFKGFSICEFALAISDQIKSIIIDYFIEVERDGRESGLVGQEKYVIMFGNIEVLFDESLGFGIDAVVVFGTM